MSAKLSDFYPIDPEALKEASEPVDGAALFNPQLPPAARDLYRGGFGFDGLDLYGDLYDRRYPRFEERPPVRRLESKGFGIQFGVVVTGLEIHTNNYGDAALYIRYQAPPREDPGAPWISIDGTARLPYSFDRMPRKDQARFVRHAIADLLMHEVDEGVFMDGVRVFDPHANEVRIPFGQPLPPTPAAEPAEPTPPAEPGKDGP